LNVDNRRQITAAAACAVRRPGERDREEQPRLISIVPIGVL
jgi:hypothetical protein